MLYEIDGLCVVVRRFIARRRADQLRQRRATLSVPTELDSDQSDVWDRKFQLTAVEPLSAEDWTRQRTKADEDCGFINTNGRNIQRCCLFTEGRVIDSPDCLTRCDVSDPECPSVSRDRRLSAEDIISGSVAAALNTGAVLTVEDALPNLPFIQVFNGIISRRAVLKVSSST